MGSKKKLIKAYLGRNRRRMKEIYIDTTLVKYLNKTQALYALGKLNKERGELIKILLND
jgi:hypothetical protein